jgi:co-chaperonin GroES (HSP10)
MKLRPLRDLVAIRPLEYKHPVLEVIGIELRKGCVVAVGPGRRMRRKVAYKNHEQNSDAKAYFEDGDETGRTRPMRVKVGDIVEYGFRGGVPFRFGREELIMVREQSIYGIGDDSQHIAVLEPRSAPVPL